MHRTNRGLLVTVGIVLLTVLAAMGPLFVGNTSFILYAVALVVGLAAVVVLIRKPVMGLVFLVVANFAVPVSVGTGTKTNLPISVFLVLLTFGVFLGQMLQSRKFRVPWAGPMLPLSLLLVATVLSFCMGQFPWYPDQPAAPLLAQLGGVGVIFLSAITFLLAAYYFWDTKWLANLTWLFLGLNLVQLVIWLIPHGGELVSLLITKSAAGSMLWTWTAALGFGQVLFNKDLGVWKRGVALTVVAGTFYLNVLGNQAWASGWVPALAAVLVILWLAMPRLGSIATAIALLLIAINWNAFLGTLLRGNAYSFDTRVEAWGLLLQMVRVNPLFGLGPANYYWYTPDFPILGFAVRFSSHNNYIDLILQTGVLGLLAFLAFIVSVMVVGWRLKGIVGEGFEQGFVFGAIGGVAGTIAAGLLGDWVLPFVYNVGLAGLRSSLFAWLFMGGLVGLWIKHNGQESRSQGREVLKRDWQ